LAVETLENDTATAAAILQAAGCTLPTGDIVDGVYDEQGNHYAVPEQCTSDPVNLLASVPADDVNESIDSKDKHPRVDEEVTRRKREEKGKTAIRDLYSIKARLSDRGGPDVKVKLGKEESVGALAGAVAEKAGV
jgi:Ubiquitin-binding domain